MHMHNQLFIIQIYNTFQQKTLYIRDLQYTRNTVIIKDWTYEKNIPMRSVIKRYFIAMIQNVSFERRR